MGPRRTWLAGWSPRLWSRTPLDSLIGPCSFLVELIPRSAMSCSLPVCQNAHLKSKYVTFHTTQKYLLQFDELTLMRRREIQFPG